MDRSKEAVAQRLAEAHYTIEPGIELIIQLVASPDREADPKEPKELDTLNVFLTTDIQNDPVLRQIFAECGCGHLFDMIKPEARAQAQAGYANDLRQYLRIDQREAQKILSRISGGRSFG